MNRDHLNQKPTLNRSKSRLEAFIDAVMVLVLVVLVIVTLSVLKPKDAVSSFPDRPLKEGDHGTLTAWDLKQLRSNRVLLHA